MLFHSNVCNKGSPAIRCRWLFLPFTFLLSLSAFSAHAATYYVATNGSDSNPGTLDRPWKTPRRALGHDLRPGDTVYFRGGNYPLDRWLSFSKDGTAAAPITYKNYQGEKPTFVYNAAKGNTGGAAAYISGDYNILDGINFHLPEEIRRRVMNDNVYFATGGRANPEAVAGIGFYGTGGILRNCHIDNFSQTPVYNGGANITVEYCRMTNNGSHGLYISSRNGTFRYNVLDGSRAYNNQEGFQMQYLRSQGNKVYGNLVINGQAAGLMMSGRMSNNHVFNNVFINGGGKTGEDKGAGWTIGFFCEDGPMGVGNKIYNNTFIGKSKHGLIGPGMNLKCNGVVPGSMVEIFNNIFHPSTPVRVGLQTPNVRNNIFYNVTGPVPPGNTLADPKLANPMGTQPLDAALTAGSLPAIDKATGNALKFDYQNGERPFGPGNDIGAFEFGARPGSGGPIDVPPTAGVTSGGGSSDPLGLGNCIDYQR